jgi:Trp operon repressor
MNIALQAKACDTLVVAQEKLINEGLKYNASQDSLLQHRSVQIATLTRDSKNWEDRFNNQVALTTIQKKKKRKWILISIGLAALGVFVNIQ